MFVKIFNSWPSKGSLVAAYTGICFLLVLKILRKFAVKSSVSDEVGRASS